MEYYWELRSKNSQNSKRLDSFSFLPAAPHELHVPWSGSLESQNYFQQHEAPGAVFPL